jgi:hypothetical protein
MSPRRRKIAELRPPAPRDVADRERVLEALGIDSRFWVLEELTFEWREAQSEAALAYRDWCTERDRTTYAIYLAAQDRADASQDALSARHAAERASSAR